MALIEVSAELKGSSETVVQLVRRISISAELKGAASAGTGGRRPPPLVDLDKPPGA